MRLTARILLPVALVAASALPAAAETWEQTYNVAGTPTLVVRANDASVNVNTWDKKSVGLRVVTSGWRIGGGGVVVDAHQEGDRVELEVREPGFSISFTIGHSARIEVMMPAKGTLDARTGDGSVTVRQLAGTIRIHTGDGSVDVTGLRGEISLETSDGRIVAEELDGRLSAHTGDGAIHASGRFDLLELTSGDGGIQASATAGSTLAADWLVRTSDGRIRLALPRDLKANLDVHTSDGGITLDMPVQVLGRVSRHNVSGQLNGGGALLKVHSGDGSITIEPV